MSSNLNLIRDTLSFNGLDAWMLVNAESKDPFFMRYVTRKTVSLSIALITTLDYIVFAHNLDADNLGEIEESGGHIVRYSSKEKVTDLLAEHLKKHPEIKKIALNYSTMNDFNVDVLGHGMFMNIVNSLKDNVDQIDQNSFVSAESVIYSLVDRKSTKEVDKMRIAAHRAHQIITDTFPRIQPGMSELDLVDLVHKITKDSSVIGKDSVVSEEYAWEESLCPIALTGPSFTKGGHAVSGETIVEEGSTVYFDFGVRLTFEDGSSWSSDIQRTGYVLRRGETAPPEDIAARFDAIINSITAGIEHIKPGMHGYEADQVVRGYLQELGFADYDHATGHAIGESAHNPGTVLSQRREGRSALLIQPGGVYTIEPRIPVVNGVSIEEMVVFYEDRPGEALCPRQTAPIIIDSHLSLS